MKTARFVALAGLLGSSLFAGSWTGVISDAKCGAAHADGSEKSVGCVKGCIKGGQAAVFVVDGKVLKFDSSSAAKITEEMHGQKVVVDGTEKDGVVTIKSIKKA